MSEPITLQGILAILGVLVAFVAGITAIWAIVKWINGAHDKMQAWDGYTEKIDALDKKLADQQTDIEAKLQEIRTEQCILTSSMLAVLEGLGQLNCNGPVTEAREELTRYLNDQAHHRKE